mgnify:CR=1 FL=1
MTERDERSLPRRRLLQLGAAGATTALLPGLSGAAEEQNDRPNIVFLMVDDMGPFDPSCMGNEKLHTPNMDRVAREGMRFTQCYTGAPVCAPCRSTLMTGQHMGHTSVRGNPGGVSLLPEDVTVAQLLKDAGYATGGFGKWGVADATLPGAAEKKGFDEFFGYYHQVHAHYYYTPYLWRNSKRVELPENNDGKKGLFTQYPIFERSMDFIRRNHEQPFFAYLPWTLPHGPHRDFPKDDPAWDLYKDKPWDNKSKVYAAMVSMADRHLGRVLELLEELGVADNTVVFVCSDNGGFNNIFNSNGPFRGTKGDLYEGGLRTFMAVRWPGKVEPGTVSDLQWYYPDVMPTLAEIAGVSDTVPSDVDGLSVVPTLLGQDDRQKKHDFLYWEYREVANWQKLTYEENLAQAIRMGRWKGVRQAQSERFQLYDLSKDVGEENNVADAHPGIVKRMDAIADREHEEPPSQEEPLPPEGRYR